MSATSSNPRALWTHPYGELFDDSAHAPTSIIHVLWRELGREPDALDYLERILGALAGIDSPFLATMRGAGRDADGRIVLAYERMVGEDLGTAVAKGPLSVERAVAVLRQLCRGLATAHAAGINHRALGPASIVLLRDGSHPDAIKIMDFGIAGVLGEAEPKYSALLPMTPERLLGFGTHTSEDVYLVGCIGYWMLAGVPPFTAEDGDALRRRHAIEDVAPLRSIDKHVPAALARVLEDALVKDPDDRTVDLAALEAALVNAQRESGIITPWDAHVHALSERARVLGESPAASGVFQTVSGRGGKRTPSGSHRPVTTQGAANHSPPRAVVATGPGAREAAASGGAAAPGAMRMPRPKPLTPVGGKVVRPIGVAKPAEVKPAEVKPAEVKPAEVKPAEVKPLVMPTKPIEAKPAAATVPAPPRMTSVPAKPIEAKPIEAKPIEAKPIEAKPIEAKPIEAKPVEAKPAEAKPADAKAVVPPKPAASPARIPPPPRLTTRPAPMRVDPTPQIAPVVSKPVTPPPPEKSLVGLSLADVEALGAGLNLPEPPPPAPPAPTPPAESIATAPAPAPSTEPTLEPAAIVPAAIVDAPAKPVDAAPIATPVAALEPTPVVDPTPTPLAIADRTDAAPLLLVPNSERRRPAWLVPALAGAGLVAVLALAYGTSASTPSTTAAPVANANAPSPAAAVTPAPSPSVASPPITNSPIATPPIATPPIATPPAQPEIAVAAPPSQPLPTVATPAVVPSDPAAKPAVTVDPLRQHLIRAKEARKKGKSEDAIQSYRAALRLAPDNRTALRELSRLYFDAGNYEQAARFGKQLVAASNASAGDRVALGDAYFKLGRTADAKAQYQKAAASGDATAKKRLAKLGG